MIKDADISDCGRYRYRLTRNWDATLPKIAWVMLNPSTADATFDDPTIKRCIQFSTDWGYGSLLVVNRFAFRSADPSVLKKLSMEEAFGERNAMALHYAGIGVNKVVCAWGNPGGTTIPSVLKCEGGLWHLGTTKSGCPKHPLYLPKTTELQRWI